MHVLTKWLNKLGMFSLVICILFFSQYCTAQVIDELTLE